MSIEEGVFASPEPATVPAASARAARQRSRREREWLVGGFSEKLIRPLLHPAPLRWRAYRRGTLYAKLNCKTIRSPLYSEGSGGNGFDMLMPATAARSRESVPDCAVYTTLETLPLFTIAN